MLYDAVAFLLAVDQERNVADQRLRKAMNDQPVTERRICIVHIPHGHVRRRAVGLVILCYDDIVITLLLRPEDVFAVRVFLYSIFERIICPVRPVSYTHLR